MPRSSPVVAPAGPDGGDEPAWTVPVAVSPLAAHVYDACTDIVFPIHTSVRAAQAAGLPRTILQGTATLSLALNELLAREGNNEPERVRSLGARFSGMVFPGETITVRMLERHSAPDGTEVLFDVLNAEGRPAVRDGCLRLGAE